jgi:hypothetical protein
LEITCIGDCNADQAVTVDELLTMVNIALGTREAGACVAGDANHDNEITIDEILTAVNKALDGCNSGSGRVRTSTGPENHQNTKERKHEKAGIPEIKNGRMKT